MTSNPEHPDRPVETGRTRKGDPGELPGKIVAAIDRLGRVRRLHRQTVASAHGLSTLQVDLLTTLDSGLPTEPSVSALAREMGVTQPTATDSLRTLKRKSLITHEPLETDRRRHVAALTPEGARIVAEADRGDRAMRDAVACLDDTEQETALAALLSIIASSVDAGVIHVARTCLTCHFHQHTGDGGHHCSLLGTDLAPAELRLNCPEHAPAGA